MNVTDRPFCPFEAAHLIGNQAAGRVGQAGGDLDFLDIFIEVLLDKFNHNLVGRGVALEVLFLRFFLFGAMDIDVAAIDGFELLAIILGSFYLTLACAKLFGGTLTDPNGIKPFRFKLPGRTVLVETNLFGFSALSIDLAVAVTNINVLPA